MRSSEPRCIRFFPYMCWAHKGLCHKNILDARSAFKSHVSYATYSHYVDIARKPSPRIAFSTNHLLNEPYLLIDNDTTPQILELTTLHNNNRWFIINSKDLGLTESNKPNSLIQLRRVSHQDTYGPVPVGVAQNSESHLSTIDTYKTLSQSHTNLNVRLYIIFASTLRSTYNFHHYKKKKAFRSGHVQPIVKYLFQYKIIIYTNKCHKWIK